MSRVAVLWDEWADEDGLGEPIAVAFGPVSAGQAPDPVQIPYSWLSPPLTRRPTTAYTKAQVSQANGPTANSSAASARVTQYGVNTFTKTLDTAVDADAAALAAFITTYESVPRPRQPIVRLDLLRRTEDECLLILRVGLGTRVTITGTPATWPAGAVSFVVEGIHHTIAADDRSVEWMTSAPIGTVAGTPGPWFRWDESYWDGGDNIAF